MNVCGVIVEYDPFHKGHERHLHLAREKTGADFIVCVMSGSFTQRGVPALLPAHARAEMALLCGADVILQLPYAFSVREAEYFALGGVSILNALGCVTHLSFGCETDDLSLLQTAAMLLETPDEALESEIQDGLQKGLSFATAQGQAVAKRLNIPAAALNAPNTALALSYLRALIRLNSAILPVPILRTSDYHAGELAALPSASAVRGAILRGDWAGVKNAMPETAYSVLEKVMLEGVCPSDGLDAILRHRLLFSAPEEIARWPGIAEGLETRILKAAETCVSREALIDAVKTRRYTRGRISRALCHGVMGVTKADLPEMPVSARILGFRESARPLLRQMQKHTKKNGFSLYARPAKEETAFLDCRADNLWCVAANLPLGETYRRQPIIIEDCTSI
ncbi:MAG: nucleotidyltransferase family protein [Clostridia bacterium]|nr:nucleotidyltransferase family protein [Clostridia bacterium]